jgi:hypothetical protein
MLPPFPGIFCNFTGLQLQRILIQLVKMGKSFYGVGHPSRQAMNPLSLLADGKFLSLISSPPADLNRQFLAKNFY